MLRVLKNKQTLKRKRGGGDSCKTSIPRPKMGTRRNLRTPENPAKTFLKLQKIRQGLEKKLQKVQEAMISLNDFNSDTHSNSSSNQKLKKRHNELDLNDFNSDTLTSQNSSKKRIARNIIGRFWKNNKNKTANWRSVSSKKF